MRDREANEFGLAIERAGGHELLSGQFRDFDELSAAVTDWDLDFVQLDAGPGSSALSRVSTPTFRIERFSFGRTYLQRGSSSPTMRTFGMVQPETRQSRMFGDELTDSDLAVFQAGGEFEAVSPPGFACLAISIDEERLDAAFESIQRTRGVGSSVAGSGLSRVDRKLLRPLWWRATGLLDQLEARPDALERAELTEDAAFQLPIDLALAIQSAGGDARRPASRARDLALRRAVSFIEDNLGDPITVRGLCDEVGVGWTTLVQAFREHFGVTPKAYLRTVRLNRVRRDLLEAEPETRIADVANRWGFWHMGQLAADYRRLFAERPSETKSRVLVSRRGAPS
jgi:AraC family ethanolamine operon transcriptional activator